ncbi:Uncharacterized protein TCM_040609 [Theobroma cacao]|uniref:RNase H type-1 domain-containing protein n=1 Tax=Theobroma cacao TaxID=3641 RepID=A0A061GSX0_THECC|nr:Uncharacterized protein TCM_040609 [Theobroma cacao]
MCLGTPWLPPLENEFKFIVDRSVTGRRALASCGGVLKDFSESLNFYFFCFLEMQDSNYAELMATKHAVQQFASSSRVGMRRTTIESDAKVAVS